MVANRKKKTLIHQTLPPFSQREPDPRAVQWYVDLAGHECKLDIGELARQDPFPVPMPIDREGYNPEHDHMYWAGGHTDWLNLQSAIEEFRITTHSGNRRLRILDVGCSTGRVLRHVHVFGGNQFEIWGTDLAPANIAWIQRHLPADFHVSTNDSNPRLPYADQFFDIVTGFSLLPHIENNELEWLAEFRRITRRDGLVYMTFGNETTWSDSADRPSTIRHFENTNSVPGNEPFHKSTFEEPLQHDRLVRRWSTEEIYNCFVWHRNRYVHEHWGKLFHIHRLVDRAHLRYQAVMLARPR
jgi:SAM-dependent methyltransferase